MFLGVELEIDEGYENKRCAQELSDIANRDAFGKNEQVQEENISKVLFLVEKYWEELQNLSWWDFVGRLEEGELITYLKERQMYVNELVEGMDEEK